MNNRIKTSRSKCKTRSGWKSTHDGLLNPPFWHNQLIEAVKIAENINIRSKRLLQWPDSGVCLKNSLAFFPKKRLGLAGVVSNFNARPFNGSRRREGKGTQIESRVKLKKRKFAISQKIKPILLGIQFLNLSSSIIALKDVSRTRREVISGNQSLNQW